ncbi:UNVERIFIED_CONTAM: hypothetical protein Sindi_0952900 [Sesamum indicum]
MDEVIEGGTVAISRTTNSSPEMGTRDGHEETETYTTARLDQAKAPSDGILDNRWIEYCCEWSGKATLSGCDNQSMHETGLRSNEDGGETPCKVDVDYEWLPPKCLDCMTLGHSTKECPLTKPKKTTKPPVAVYVPKPFATRVTTEPVRVQKPRQDCAVVDGMKDGDNPASTRQDNRALDLIDDTDEQSGGPNTRSPIGYDPC